MTFIALLATVLAVFLLLIKEDGSHQPYSPLKQDAVILAFGDSLTYGYGVKSGFSYPSQLAAKTGLKVINAGISGEESSEGLQRLQGVLKQNPDIVILCHGGNDILRKHSLLQLKNNLLAMIDMIHKNGAKVLLVGVPDFGWLGFNTLPLYNEVAKERDVIFEEDTLGLIEADTALKSDRIHPNEKGYEMMADAFIEVLTDNGLLSHQE